MKAAVVFAIPNLRPLGRFCPEKALRAGVLPLFWTGSGLELCFTGGELHFILDVDFTQIEPWAVAEVNGALLLRTPLRRGENDLCIFRGLADGAPKRVRLMNETQPAAGDPAHCVSVRELRWDCGDFLPLPAPNCRLEFIGDSLTSGEGVYGAPCETEWAAAWLSAVRGFPCRTAELLGADFRIISQSGWGIRSGWDNDPRHALPDFYEQVCGPSQGGRALGAQEPNDFTAWVPDAVVVNLGTNDAGAMENPPWWGADGVSFQQRSTPEGSMLLENAAVDFLKTLRRQNPHAKLIWAYGMLGDSLRPCLEGAVARFRRETGDEYAYALSLPAVTEAAMGARRHPGAACHMEAAETLAEFLQKMLEPTATLK